MPTKKQIVQCKVAGCPEHSGDRSKLCPMHLARSQRSSRNATYAGVLRDGTRTTAINVRLSPRLKRSVQARADKLGISTARAAEDLLRRALDKKSCPYHPFCPRKP